MRLKFLFPFMRLLLLACLVMDDECRMSMDDFSHLLLLFFSDVV